jgi:hypothetical protein
MFTNLKVFCTLLVLQNTVVSYSLCKANKNMFAAVLFSSNLDPNFEAHLPELLKAGSKERSSPDLAKELREKYSTIEQTKRKAAIALKEVNAELAAEVKN